MNASRARGFPLFWAGRTASQFGDQITLLALPWLIADATASPLAVGALEAVAFAPMLLFGLPLGALADRRSRRRSMIEADVLRAILVASIPLTILFLDIGTSVALVLMITFFVGVGHALFEASAQAFLTDLVPPDEIVRANARLSLTEGLAEVVGPATAGVLIAVLGATGALAVDAATFALSAVALIAVTRVRERFSIDTSRMRTAIREGIQIVTRQRRLRTLTLVIGASNLGSGMVAGLIILFMQRTIGLEGWGAGLVYAVNGVGGIAASFVSQRLVHRFGISRTVLAGLTGAGAGFTLLAITTADWWFVTATTGMALIGLGVVTSFIASASLRQRIVPSELLGRVTTSYRTVVNGAVALGALTGGVVGEFVGVRVALLLGAGVYVSVTAVGFFTVLNSPDLPEIGEAV